MSQVASTGHSAALNANLAPPVYDPLHLATDPAIRSLRIYLDAGKDDWVLPGMEQLSAPLTAAGVPHDYAIRGLPRRQLLVGARERVPWVLHGGLVRACNVWGPALPTACQFPEEVASGVGVGRHCAGVGQSHG